MPITATRPELKPHKITVGTREFIVSLPDVYTNISNVVGIQEFTGTPSGNETKGSVRSLYAEGRIDRISISVRSGTTTYSFKIWSAADQTVTAIAQLPGKTFRTGTITSATQPARARLG